MTSLCSGDRLSCSRYSDCTGTRSLSAAAKGEDGCGDQGPQDPTRQAGAPQARAQARKFPFFFQNLGAPSSTAMSSAVFDGAEDALQCSIWAIYTHRTKFRIIFIALYLYIAYIGDCCVDIDYRIAVPRLLFLNQSLPWNTVEALDEQLSYVLDAWVRRNHLRINRNDEAILG